MDKLSDHKDFMWYILKHREKKMELSDDEIIVNSALFMYLMILPAISPPFIHSTNVSFPALPAAKPLSVSSLA